MKIISWMSAVAVMSLAAASAGAQGRLLVAQKGDRSLAIVDPGAGAVIANVAENGITGHEVAGSPDGRLAFVPIYGNSGVGKPGTDGNNIVVIDVAAQKLVGNIQFDHGVRPHCAVFGPKDGLLYVTTELDRVITIIDPKTLKIVGSIPTGQPESHMLALSHDGLPRLHGECGAGNGERARHKGAEDACDYFRVGQHAADCDFRMTTVGCSQPTRLRRAWR